jgi:formylglycine-generating enzyme required for sulfatase activity
VVGVNEFQNPKVARLNYAVNDATSVAQALQALGFPATSITQLLNRQATKAEIDRVLNSVLRRRAGPNDRVVIFFATHGVTLPLPGGGEEGYLLPYDADPDDLPFTAFSMSQIKQIGQRLPAKHTLVAVDSCYGGYSLIRSQAPSAVDRQYLELITKSRAVQVMTAGKKDQPVIEDQGHGVFTRKLLDGLAGHADTNRDGLITLSELGAWLHPRVAQASDYKQDMQWGNLDGEGQFVFVLPQVMKGESDEVMKKREGAGGLGGGGAGEQQPTQLPPVVLVPPPAPARPSTGFLVFQGRPSGTRILLDGREVGTVADLPLRLEANAGTYSLRLEASGYRPREARIEVKANTEQPIQFDLEQIIEALRAGTIQRRGKDNAEMVFVPAGTFTMGDTHGDGYPDEKPTHPVSLPAFWLDRTEVTNAQFARFIQAGNTAQGDWRQYASGKDQHPVVNVTWPDAVAYCRWAAKRLPTEAEWEYAARGTDNRKFPWGNAFEDNRGRFSGRTAPVGSYPSGASPFGVLDLAGNVWEWVASLSRPYPYSATDGREDLSAAGGRVIRGGSWSYVPRDLRSAARDRGDPADRSVDLGFRCAQAVQ